LAGEGANPPGWALGNEGDAAEPYAGGCETLGLWYVGGLKGPIELLMPGLFPYGGGPPPIFELPKPPS